MKSTVTLGLCSLTLVCCVVALSSPVQVFAQAWAPTFSNAGGGGYCAPDLFGGRREPREGGIVLSHRGVGLQVRISTRWNSYGAGREVFARTENIGDVLLVEPFGFEVDRLVGEEWHPVGPRNLIVPRSPSPLLGAGRARCMSFYIPEHPDPGRYRIVKIVEYGNELGGELSKLELSHEFDVRPKVMIGPKGRWFG